MVEGKYVVAYMSEIAGDPRGVRNRHSTNVVLAVVVLCDGKNQVKDKKREQ